jgi:FkbM family methyltransferase
MHMRIHRLIDYARIGGVRVAVPLFNSMFVGAGPLAKLSREEVRFPFHIRVRTSDYSCYRQIFVDQEYAFETCRHPLVIIDAGANIGLASIYFANRFREARIFAIEPERSNFRILSRNCEPYEQITAIDAALWHENTEVQLVDPGTGKWGFMSEAVGRKGGSTRRDHHLARGLTVDHLFDKYEIDHVDILKIDIEGSEKEVFSERPTWLHKVDTLVIETHDWLRPGCERSVNLATSDFDDRWRLGENQIITRRRGCVVRRRVH